MNKTDIAHYQSEEQLRNGKVVTIRAIRPEDKGQIADAIRDISAESLYRRTFSAKRELSDGELKDLTEVDFVKVVALVAVMREEGRDRIVGGGRYIRMTGSGAGPKAEVAFLVDDEHQGLGIGSWIFRHLVTIARATGVSQFEAEVLPSNEGMLRLFMRSGLSITTTASRESVHVTIELSGGQDSRGRTR